MSKLVAPRTSVPSLGTGTHADSLSSRTPAATALPLSTSSYAPFSEAQHGLANDIAQRLSLRSSIPGGRPELQKLSSQRQSSPHVTGLQLDALRTAAQTEAYPQAPLAVHNASAASTPRSQRSKASSFASLQRPALSNSNASLDERVTPQSAALRTGKALVDGAPNPVVPTLPLPLSAAKDGTTPSSLAAMGFVYEWHDHQMKPLKRELEERRESAEFPADEWNQGLSVQDNQGKDVDLRCALFEIQFPISVILPKRRRNASFAQTDERAQPRRDSRTPSKQTPSNPTMSQLAPSQTEQRASIRSVVSRQSLRPEALATQSRRESNLSDLGKAREEEGMQQSASQPSSVRSARHADDLDEQTPAMRTTALSSGSAAPTNDASLDASAGQGNAGNASVSGSTQGKLLGLGGALSSFGSPAEWWHDSIILGRLSAVAMRYFAMRAMRSPWKSWLEMLEKRRRKRKLEALQRAGVALRVWHWRSINYGKKMKTKVPLVRALTRIPRVALIPAWERLRQAIFFRRDLERRKRMLLLIERKMFDTLARAHYYQSLLRLGFASLWMAARVPPYHRRKNQEVSKPDEQAGGHVRQVLRRVWRRWFFSTKMWLSFAEYRERETEAWLTGECGTPRSIVTSSRAVEEGAIAASADSAQAVRAAQKLQGLGNFDAPPWRQDQDLENEQLPGMEITLSREVPFPEAGDVTWPSTHLNLGPGHWQPQKVADESSSLHMETGRLPASGQPRKKPGPAGLLQPMADAEQRKRASDEGANKYTGNHRASLAPFGPRYQAVVEEEPFAGQEKRPRRKSFRRASLHHDIEEPPPARSYWDDAELHNGVGEVDDENGFVLGSNPNPDAQRKSVAKMSADRRSLVGAVSPEARDYWQMRCQIGNVTQPRQMKLGRKDENDEKDE